MTQTVLLGDIAEINMGQSPKSEFYNTSGEGLPFMQGVRTFGRMHPLIDTWCTKPTKTADKGDVLFSVRAPVGDLNFAPEYMCIGRGLASLKSRNNRFLYYLLEANKDRLISSQTGSVFGSVNATILKKFRLTIPESIEEQDRIADILGTIDEKIELNRKMNETLEQMGQALFRHYFVDNPEVENWRQVTLPSLIEFIGGSQPPKSEHIYEEREGYVRFVQNRDYASDGHKTYIPIAKRNKLCNETDIMMDKYGEAGRVRFGIAGAYNVALAKIVPQKENMQEFLRAYFSMPQIQQSLESAAAASTRSSLNATTFAGFKVKMPTDELLIDFENSHKDILHKIMANAEQIQTLTLLRDTLLPRLISGKVKI